MKIYISSTFQDLQEYREKAYRQLRSLRHDVISMEDYVAAHQRPLAQCLADVAASDVYVGIFAWRYGFVPAQGNPQKRSITELEYRHALKHKKPCLIFLLKQDTQWSPLFMDSQTGEGKTGKSIKRLRDELSQRHVVSFFGNPDQLASAISAALFPVQFAETPVTAAPPATAAPPPARAARASRAGATATTAPSAAVSSTNERQRLKIGPSIPVAAAKYVSPQRAHRCACSGIGTANGSLFMRPAKLAGCRVTPSPTCAPHTKR